ncbi:MAG: DUF1501 domain-containing protein [Polyangiaceae bacterium]|nr:DUF1501 domain-containing protein [Polyangiaceae bacterium]
MKLPKKKTSASNQEPPVVAPNAASKSEDSLCHQKQAKKGTSRRRILQWGAAAAAGVAFPHIWVPRPARAAGGGAGSIRHLIYIRLSGGFRFPCAFNADVAEQFNPFGLQSDGVPSGVDWGVSSLLSRSAFLDGEGRRDLGMKPVHQFADRITVMPAVDHEPLAGRADGNHETGLERYYTGYVNGEAGFFTRIFRGLKGRYAAAEEAGEVILPPFVMGGAAMARGFGEYAAYRPPVLNGATFERFSAQGEGVPSWATDLVGQADRRMRDRQHPALREQVDSYIRSRAATASYADIFDSDALKVDRASDELIDGISNTELRSLFGNGRTSANLRLALRLFQFGCPAVYLDQGGYDYHSGEENALPGAIESLNHQLSALFFALEKMQHPEGGSYWDHTLVVLGSEFSRTARGGRFNSARGSDHNGDNSTRWMSMPFFGGAVPGGRVVGASTSRDSLEAEGKVYSYRSVMNTLMEGLGCDESVFFPGDECVQELYGDS